jgi:hypothetical protein
VTTRAVTTVVEIDTAKLWGAINYRLYRTSKTAKEVADLLGFTPQVFSDLKSTVTGRGRKSGTRYQPGSAIFLTICWWLGADPRDFQRVLRRDVRRADDPAPGEPGATLLAPQGCDDCSAEPGELHQWPGCPGNVRALAAYNGTAGPT